MNETKEKCARCKKPIERSAVVHESFGDFLYYHSECFQGCFIFMQEVKEGVEI